jgi:hypothetical protein
MFRFCFKPVRVSNKINNIYEQRLCNLTQKANGHLYLIKEREFIKTNENIFKIGKSKNIKNRMPSYPKDSVLYYICFCRDIDIVEKFMIAHFSTVFIQRQDIGTEYFECIHENDICNQFVDIMKNLVTTK